MRERITYLQKRGSSLPPSSLSISPTSLRGPTIRAIREERLTFSLDELPRELSSVLSGVHELHVRWVSPRRYESVGAMVGRLPAGWHIFWTPGGEWIGDGKLGRVMGGEAFTKLPGGRFTHAAALQYFQPLESLEGFVGYAKGKLCATGGAECGRRVDAVKGASALDVSYDTISHALKVTALWTYQEQEIKAVGREGVRTEVGVLSDEKTPTMEDYELGVSGLLTVLGQDEKPSATVFSFPSRHRDAESGFSAGFTQVGLHPVLQLKLGSNKPPVEGVTCAPHAYFTFPRTIFADRYQLSDDLFLASKNLTALRYISQPVDLEAPEYVMKTWGSAALLELKPPAMGEKDEAWTAEVPLHLRYLTPTHGGYVNLEVPYPAVFWACNAEEGTKFPTNPFERANLGYDGLFGPRTVFWYVEPRPETGDRVTSPIRVPVLDLDKAGWVNIGTAAAVLLGFAWVSWKLLSVYLKTGYGASRISETSEKKRQ
ncbi:PIG-X [Podospora aff. communis PSN243]|uniref:Protein PBN1 n=1 Tax=Podospora aff. communis PSN243 TaxID=3040156 RepID=A0AAV9GJE6_9PEZI|nr:PIG-X [Podospora aff. communis PSN243]